MKIFHYSDVKPKRVLRWLITKDIGSENFVMRLAEKRQTAPITHHTHPWEHGVFVLEGEGIVSNGREERSIGKGSVIFIPPNEPHGFGKTGEETLRFICIIPAGVDLDKIRHVGGKPKPET